MGNYKYRQFGNDHSNSYNNEYESEEELDPLSRGRDGGDVGNDLQKSQRRRFLMSPTKVYPYLSSNLSTSSSSPEFIEHPVSRMDTLAGVAIKYGVEVNLLIYVYMDSELAYTCMFWDVNICT